MTFLIFYNSWLEGVDGRPGISAAALSIISDKHNLYSDVCLIIDAMHIKISVSMDQTNNELFGFVDLGDGQQGVETEATEILVFMISSLKLHGRLPIAYYSTNRLSGEAMADLVRNAIQALDTRGFCVYVVTMDGAACNVSMAKYLGCSLNITSINPRNTLPGIDHDIYIYFYPCNMIKLIRNNLEKCEKWQTTHGPAKWDHIKLVHSTQDSVGLPLGTRLTSCHINFQNNKMKVSLAVQTLSKSVAAALELLHAYMMVGDVHGTVHLLKISSLIL